jgi:hypothetical protein
VPRQRDVIDLIDAAGFHREILIGGVVGAPFLRRVRIRQIGSRVAGRRRIGDDVADGDKIVPADDRIVGVISLGLGEDQSAGKDDHG